MTRKKLLEIASRRLNGKDILFPSFLTDMQKQELIDEAASNIEALEETERELALTKLFDKAVQKANKRCFPVFHRRRK